MKSIIRAFGFSSLLLLMACHPDKAAAPSAIQSQGQCSKDTDCKGDRVCDQGQCKSPEAKAPLTANSAPKPSVAGPAAQIAKQVKWIEGGGQGITEYLASFDEYRIIISCPPSGMSDGMFAGVGLEQDHRDVKSFKITAGGLTFDGPFDASSRAGANDFGAFLDAMRDSDATISVGNETFLIAKSNAKSVLPSSKKNSCNNGFSTASNDPAPVSLEDQAMKLKIGKLDYQPKPEERVIYYSAMLKSQKKRVDHCNKFRPMLNAQMYQVCLNPSEAG